MKKSHLLNRFLLSSLFLVPSIASATQKDYEEAVSLRTLIKYSVKNTEIEDNYIQSFNKMKQAVTSQDSKSWLSDAQYELAEYYKHGIGTTKDNGKALEYYILASTNNHPLAANALGVFLENIEKDYEGALSAYELSFNLGYKLGGKNYQNLLRTIKSENQDLDDRSNIEVQKILRKNKSEKLNISQDSTDIEEKSEVIKNSFKDGYYFAIEDLAKNKLEETGDIDQTENEMYKLFPKNTMIIKHIINKLRES